MMDLENNFSSTIHITLKDLIEKKSKRDNIKFTSYQLANALSMPRSIITKLMHYDETKRVDNPRIDTLLKIVNFFKKDGFNITVDDFLGFKTQAITVQDQKIVPSSDFKTIPLYPIIFDKKNKIGTIELNISNAPDNLLALHTDEDIEPFFKSGSIFIIDVDMAPIHDTLIAIRFPNSNKINIKKYILKNKSVILRSLNFGEKDLLLLPTMSCEILGVVVQVNAKT